MVRSALLLMTAVFALSPLPASADDDLAPQPCAFKAHTTVGTVTGFCWTQQVPAAGYTDRWKLVLKFDDASSELARKLKADRFCDMMRAQSTEDGTDVIVLTLWGDIQVVPLRLDYWDMLSLSAPLYETRPFRITVAPEEGYPTTITLLFEEPEEYFDPTTRMPSSEWLGEFLASFYRLGTNRPTGFHN